MADHLLVHVTDADQLKEVDGLLHDAGFSVLDLKYDERLGVVQVPFHRNQKTHDLLVRKPRGDDVDSKDEAFAERVLEVNHVRGMTVHDPDGLVEHSYARLEFSSSGHLAIKSNFPGGVDLEVSEIDVQVKA
ncbi:MAG: hypothetical protein ACLQPH_02815 [Acidimicrobiales bacterium]